MNWIKTKPIAHRGIHSNKNGIPENSLLAFHTAIKKKYPIELDIHMLADDNFAVFHDDNLERMCGENIKINELTSLQLKKYNLLSTKEKIPLLQEVFNLINGQVPILIEIKSYGKSKDGFKCLYNMLSNYNGEFAIQSFNPFILGWFVKNAPSILRGQLASRSKNPKILHIPKIVLKHFGLNFISKPNFISCDFNDIPNKKVEKFKSLGKSILCWTIRNEQEYKKIQSFCDNIIFENFLPEIH